MLRAWVIGLLIAALVATAAGDRVVLLDGRTVEGTVTVEGQSVRVEMTYGTVQFDRAQVLRIEFKDTPETELARKLAETPLDDAEAVFQVAQWAQGNSLDERGQELHRVVLKLDGDHAGARRALGFVRIERKWIELDAGIELARSKLEAAQYQILLRNVLPALADVAPRGPKLQTVRELKGLAQLRSKDFAAAAQTFADLARSAKGAAKLRFAAVAEILKTNADGMYVLPEPYPPEAGLLGRQDQALTPGPASLARPIVLEAALHQRARKDIQVGRELMEGAAKAEPTDPDAAKVRYFQASQAFDRAEAIRPNIARSWRVEICRRRIAARRKDVAAGARKFDEESDTLGRKDMSGTAYRGRILRLTHRLNSVREDLQAILAIAGSYPRDLVLEISQAESDLDRINKLRMDLVSELDGER